LKISTKGRYGLEAIIDMAINSPYEQINLKSIAERCGLSEPYILQIFLTLRRAGIVESTRGAQGGYILAKDPSQITVGHILYALEGPLAPVSCIVNGSKHECDRFELCTTKDLWEEIMNTLNKVVDSITIKDLVVCYSQFANKNTEPEYFI
jgi:Rrf2 family cysteine metabolism transcriptional repressor